MSISTLMLLGFVLGVGLSIWKMSAFLPTKQLHDDDTTKEAIEELEQFILKVIHETEGKLEGKKLCEAIKNHTEFNKELFWRFNENKLRKFLQSHFLKNPHLSSVREIYEDLKQKL